MHRAMLCEELFYANNIELVTEGDWVKIKTKGSTDTYPWKIEKISATSLTVKCRKRSNGRLVRRQIRAEDVEVIQLLGGTR